jgi:hypothetical protein
MMNIISLFLVALIIGGMVFFAAVIAPLVFTKLPPEHAGKFIRQVFPAYYLYHAILSILAAILLAFGRELDAAMMAAFAVLTIWLRQGLMPMINRQSDAAQAGDAAAKRRFDGMHRLSVVLNLVQMALAGVVLARF